ncbi:MAG TPA: DEAD/DEAH box helicase [Polyangiales bacterium]|nr:DEAD/DEAH box helicase [Polyangiales bacterium]
MKFSDLGLSQPVLRALDAAGYQSPTPIQVQAIPHVLSGRDLIGCAQTGTGKTAAFALPILDRLLTAPKSNGKAKTRVLVLSPTRELAAQIGDSFTAYSRHTQLKCAVVFGGVNIQRQIQELGRGVDVLVATPGRLLDLMQLRAASLADINTFVLDEADRMLDMGFVNDVMKIARAVPKTRQTLLFSATLPNSIRSLAHSLLTSPVHVAVDPVSSTAETLDQSVYFVDKADKRNLLAWVLRDLNIDRTLTFTRTKHGADRVAEFLQKRGITAAALHGNKSQNARQRALDSFKSGKLRVLVATDIAARGIDIEQLSHVINYELPNTLESYVHRIGRSGRAGASGAALSFVDSEERAYLRNIERSTRVSIRVVDDHPHLPGTGGAPHDRQPAARTERSPRDRQSARSPRDRQPAHSPRDRQHTLGRRADAQRPAPRRDAVRGRLDEQLGAVERAAGDGITQPEARAVKPGFSSPRRRRGF